MVSFYGDKGFIYKSNLSLRTAIRILKPILKFNASNEFELYDAISSIERLSIVFYLLVIMSFSIIGIGLRRYQKRKALESLQNPLKIICSSTVNLKAKKVFIITFILYGIFFSSR